MGISAHQPGLRHLVAVFLVERDFYIGLRSSKLESRDLLVLNWVILAESANDALPIFYRLDCVA